MLVRSRFADRAFRLVLAASLSLILLGSRAVLIGFAGSPFPYMDEWDGDWGGLLRPWLEGRLTPEALVAPFNEHRILFTRLLALGLFNLAGYWDVVLQMTVNACIGSSALVILAFTLARVLDGGTAVAAIVAIVVVNVVPVGFENILFGFNTHFYLAPVLSLAGLALAVPSPAWSRRWAAGVVLGAASWLCLASGALTLVALAATQGLQFVCRKRGGAREALGLVTLCAISALMVALVPHVPDSDGLRARSPAEFVSAALALAQWPAGAGLGLLLPLPTLLFCRRVAADRPDLRDARWLNLAAAAWVAVQIAAIADGRAQAALQSRYFDTLMLGLAVHFVSALWLLRRPAAGETTRKAARLLLVAWSVVFGFALAHDERGLPGRIESWREAVEAGGESVRFYLATGDVSFLSGQLRSIPYPRPAALQAYLDSPWVRAALPPELLSRAPHATPIETAKRALLKAAPALVGLGGAALLVALIWRRSMARELAAPAPADALRQAFAAPGAEPPANAERSTWVFVEN